MQRTDAIRTTTVSTARKSHRPTRTARTLAAALALAGAVCAADAKSGFTLAAEPGDDPVGALIGELYFQADLLSALDRLCPRGRAATDWHGTLASRVKSAYTPDLRELSRKLGAVAGAQVVREQGGCATSGFDAAYRESKDEYRTLMERWTRQNR